MDEVRLLQIDLMKCKTDDLLAMLKNPMLGNEQRYQILHELQRRNADGRRKQFLET